MGLINDDEVFVDEVFQFAVCMLDFSHPGFYVRLPEPPVTLEPTAATDAPTRNVSFGLSVAPILLQAVCRMPSLLVMREVPAVLGTLIAAAPSMGTFSLFHGG
jgi:hypothetical protein